MPQANLLKLTQDILSSMRSDNVNDIAETDESIMVAQHIKDAYFDMMAGRDWPHLAVTSQLTGLGDTTNPTRMQIPSDVSRIVWLKYDRRVLAGDPRRTQTVQYMEPEAFMNLLDGRVSTGSNITEYTDASSIKLNIRTDTAPSYWTSFDDDYILFDSFNSALESSLQASKSMVYAVREPAWSHTNSHIPDLPSHMQQLLFNEAKATCFAEIKGEVSLKTEKKVRKNKARMQHASWRQDGTPRSPNYGRK